MLARYFVLWRTSELFAKHWSFLIGSCSGWMRRGSAVTINGHFHTNFALGRLDGLNVGRTVIGEDYQRHPDHYRLGILQ